MRLDGWRFDVWSSGADAVSIIGKMSSYESFIWYRYILTFSPSYTLSMLIPLRYWLGWIHDMHLWIHLELTEDKLGLLISQELIFSRVHIKLGKVQKILISLNMMSTTLYRKSMKQQSTYVEWSARSRLWYNNKLLPWHWRLDTHISLAECQIKCCYVEAIYIPSILLVA